VVVQPSEEAGAAHADVAGPTDDDVVVECDAEPTRGIGDGSRHLYVGLRRGGIAAWVVVDQ